MQAVSIVGCGYTGTHLARRLSAAGYAVRGYGTNPASLAKIAAAGAAPGLLDLDQPVAPRDWSGEIIHYLVPPPRDGNSDPRLEGFLRALQGHPARLVYMSTTGVYGDQGGGRVDEDTEPKPQSERAHRRLAAENQVRAWAEARAISWCILRVPGIYGPGRVPLERLRLRVPAIDPREATPGNRIHVEDLAAVCLAAGSLAQAHRRIYNVTDGNEESQTAFLNRLARLAHLPPPPLIARAAARAQLGESSWSFLAESRRVDNRRMCEELGVTLAFTDLDQGIRASLDAALI
jgi:nucleoside-diphosphate-sugar epimerase